VCAREVDRVGTQLVASDLSLPFDDDLKLVDFVKMSARDAVRVVLDQESLRRAFLACLDE
jgi:hypothetical protein